MLNCVQIIEGTRKREKRVKNLETRELSRESRYVIALLARRIVIDILLFGLYN